MKAKNMPDLSLFLCNTEIQKSGGLFAYFIVLLGTQWV
jgi:hypothetical protein